MMEEKINKLINCFILKNNQINLSAIRDEEWIRIKHINDSLELNKVLKLKPWYKVIDLWTWGWFPLIPLAISNPEVYFTWIDARRKKIDAINEIIKELWINNAKWIWARWEDHKEKYDILVTRAVWYVDKLFQWWYHLIKNWWYFILFKQKNEEEESDLLKICKKKWIKIEKKHTYKLFEWDIERIIYVLKK